MLRRLLGAAVAVLVLGLPGVAQAAGGYVSPFSTTDYYVGRTDMGVDVCLQAGDPIRAIGDGVVVGVYQNWFEKQPYIWYELTSGPDSGRYVYVAEQITHLAHAGDTVSAGQTIATYANKGSCIETGWSAADGETLAAFTTGYAEGDVTQAGISFARLLIGAGVQGSFELSAPKAQTASRHRKATVAKPKAKATTITHATPRAPKPATRTSRAPAQPSGGITSVPPPASGGSGLGGASGSSTASGSASGGSASGGATLSG